MWPPLNSIAVWPCTLLSCRLAQIVLVDAPWFFKGPWEVIKALLGRHTALVCFASRQQLARKFFTPDTVPDDFRQ